MFTYQLKNVIIIHVSLLDCNFFVVVHYVDIVYSVNFISALLQSEDFYFVTMNMYLNLNVFH